MHLTVAAHGAIHIQQCVVYSKKMLCPCPAVKNVSLVRGYGKSCKLVYLLPS